MRETAYVSRHARGNGRKGDGIFLFGCGDCRLSGERKDYQLFNGRYQFTIDWREVKEGAVGMVVIIAVLIAYAFAGTSDYKSMVPARQQMEATYHD